APALAQRLEVERGERDVAGAPREPAVHDAALEPALGERPQRRLLQCLRDVREIRDRLEAGRAGGRVLVRAAVQRTPSEKCRTGCETAEEFPGHGKTLAGGV